ncbi:hypothetical protein [Aquitalea denitrificans]|uniref:hypothetical protein n=1 Tax=Aquitalea denitrificans TaxID=519081 RepID=UPI00135C842D|nr:hypothetical protein [Aquitalea denitrificans]
MEPVYAMMATPAYLGIGLLLALAVVSYVAYEDYFQVVGDTINAAIVMMFWPLVLAVLIYIKLQSLVESMLTPTHHAE